VEREMEMVLGWNGSRHQSWASPWSNSGAHIHFLRVGDGRRSAAALLCASRHRHPLRLLHPPTMHPCPRSSTRARRRSACIRAEQALQRKTPRAACLYAQCRAVMMPMYRCRVSMLKMESGSLERRPGLAENQAQELPAYSSVGF
jgi:hypothetical protein